MIVRWPMLLGIVFLCLVGSLGAQKPMLSGPSPERLGTNRLRTRVLKFLCKRFHRTNKSIRRSPNGCKTPRLLRGMCQPTYKLCSMGPSNLDPCLNSTASSNDAKISRGTPLGLFPSDPMRKTPELGREPPRRTQIRHGWGNGHRSATSRSRKSRPRGDRRLPFSHPKRCRSMACTSQPRRASCHRR